MTIKGLPVVFGAYCPCFRAVDRYCAVVNAPPLVVLEHLLIDVRRGFAASSALRVAQNERAKFTQEL